jgi:hypothetical protein
MAGSRQLDIHTRPHAGLVRFSTLAFFVVGPLQPALLAEQKIIYFTNQFEHPLWVLLDGGFLTKLFPALGIVLHQAPDPFGFVARARSRCAGEHQHSITLA